MIEYLIICISYYKDIYLFINFIQLNILIFRIKFQYFDFLKILSKMILKTKFAYFLKRIKL